MAPVPESGANAGELPQSALPQRAAYLLVGLGIAAGIQASAADALFIEALGSRHLGTAFAASSLALMVVLGVLGVAADRVSRRRLLMSVCFCASAVSVLVAGVAVWHSAIGGTLAVVAGKQMAAAADLAFWVFIAERLSPRQVRQHMGRFVVFHGGGVVLGAVAVGPVARFIGLEWTFGLGAVGFACGALLFAGRGIAGDESLKPVVTAPRKESIVAPFLSSALARGLALVVFAGGVFAPIMYYLAAAHVADVHPHDATRVAELLGWFRGATQVATLVAQAFLTPIVLSRLGVAGALNLAPTVAVMGAVSVVFFPVLAVVLAAQGLMRVVDSACDDPAEKLAMNLLPLEVRGRVGGALDGITKRAGSVLGGALASLLVPAILLPVTLVSALLWSALAWWFARRLPDLAVRELSARGRLLEPVVENFADARGIARLQRELRSESGIATAMELLAQLTIAGRADFTHDVAQALGDSSCTSPERVYLAAVSVAFRTPFAVQPVALEDIASPADDSWKSRWLAHCYCIAGGETPAPHSGTDEEALGDAFAALSAALKQDASASDAALKLLRVHRDLVAPHRGLVASALATCLEFGLANSSSAEWILASSALVDSARTWLDAHPSRSESDVEHRMAALRILSAAKRDEDAAAIARLLADAEDEIAEAAEHALESRGPLALESLLVAASVGRRRGRERALTLLRQMPASRAHLDALIHVELSDLADTTTRIAPLSVLPAADLLRRRLRERILEITGTLLMALEARYRDSTITAAGKLCFAARSVSERSRALEALHAALPAALRDPVLTALDDMGDEERAMKMAALRGSSIPQVDQAVQAELHGKDKLSRAFAVHALGSEGRSRFRTEITAAAQDAARSYDALAVMRRLVGTASLDEDMPGQVETLLALRQVSLFAELSTRELSELASVVSWLRFGGGDVIVEQGQSAQAMYFVFAGLVSVTEGETQRELAVLGPGEPFGEMALFDEIPRTATVTAREDTRIGQIHRADFAELVDQVPGIALGICKVLSRRLRSQVNHST